MAFNLELFDATRKARRDLRTPMINIRGFTGELVNAIDHLTALVDEHRQALPEDFLDGVHAICQDDLAPRFHCLGAATEQLNGAIDNVAQLVKPD